MKNKIQKIIFFASILLLFSCATIPPRYNYQPRKRSSKQIDLKSKISVRIYNVEFKSINNDIFNKEYLYHDIREAIINDLNQNLFSNISNNKPLINVDICINSLKYQSNLTPWAAFGMFSGLSLIFLPLGIPITYVKGSADISVQISSFDELIVEYNSNNETKKFVGLYYNGKYVYGQNNSLTQLPITQAMDDIKSQIE